MQAQKKEEKKKEKPFPCLAFPNAEYVFKNICNLTYSIHALILNLLCLNFNINLLTLI